MSDRPLDDAARGDAPRADAYEPRPGLTHRDADWAGLNVLVAGLGVSGFAAAVALAERDAHVIAVDASDEPSAEATDRDRVLAILEADVRRGAAHTLALPDDRPVDLVVTSPGWRPDQPLLAEAAARGIPVWGEVELAWRMRAETGAAPWLTVTGTNGKTTTVTMLASILQASGLRAAAVGNVGTPIIEAVLDPAGFDVLAVELSSFQLHWSRSISPVASVCLNVAPDHLDWHGSELEYHRAKGKVYDNTQVACLYNVEDPTTELMVMEADVVEGCRAVGFTLGVPAVSMLGVVDEVLADRAFIAQRHDSAAELGTLADLRGDAPSVAPHYVANALAAAGLARAFGVGPLAVREGLRAYRPEKHRIAEVATISGVRYVDDSKATNAHAAAASLRAFDPVVWIAGGLLKGADVDDLVREAAPRLRGVVLLGRDRAQIADALARHAPDVPVVDVASTDTDAMTEVVAAATALAQPGDVVLLAPAAASMDMFANYGARGDAFAKAVRAQQGPTEGA
ncbi:UDP-N-acetylmuramoyl-L-alanine--D-glutamate ligase [Arsenicicoccus piscis]|uniref:UDP-N-acetylmuramoyl-L-alanine--D-glutamate ligase n=1 Tax=Arsenicicoccus piscis TaxID=673954 RepID=UPI001F4D2732|nr:UDP-N-acetylmuramoyl-L-alanine--D-glutamate ligase [Arsenicicoccus piscis]MCH8627107.1 UDP-N-acetylmuramoyl-L-alanine--D-glutamate ligase [Arsenicicoccus piscis]